MPAHRSARVCENLDPKSALTAARCRLGDDVSGPVAIVLVKGAGTIMQQRPQFLGRLLPPLLALANSGAFKVWMVLRGGGWVGGMVWCTWPVYQRA